MYVFISEGASVFGVFWKIIRTPSTSNSSMGFLTIRVGAMSPRCRSRLPSQALGDVAVRVHGHQHAVLVEHPPVHRVAGVDILGDGELHEAAGEGSDLARAARRSSVTPRTPPQWSPCECE